MDGRWEVSPVFDVNSWQRQHRSASGFLPRIVCADGFSMSVQAGFAMYSSPRTSADVYDTVEVGFPSTRVEVLMPYIDGDDSKPTHTVYGYVPVHIVNDIVAAHGGLAEVASVPESLLRVGISLMALGLGLGLLAAILTERGRE